MNFKKVKSFVPISTEKEESYFECFLENGQKIDVPYWSFYEFIIKRDENLKNFSEKFYEWEQLTEELLDFGYDFNSKLDDYLAQFNEDDMDDFLSFYED